MAGADERPLLQLLTYQPLHELPERNGVVESLLPGAEHECDVAATHAFEHGLQSLPVGVRVFRRENSIGYQTGSDLPSRSTGGGAHSISRESPVEG